MKRLFSTMLALTLLLLLVASALPIFAADDVDEVSWRKLTYSKAPTEEGGETIQGKITQKCEVPAFSTIHFNAEITQLLVNGEEAPTEGYQTTYAGNYVLTVINKAKPTEKVEYTIMVLADINVIDGQVFTSYPTITCTNGTDMMHTYDNSEYPNFMSGTKVYDLGKHLITVFGINEKGQRVTVKNYKFYVKACDAVRVFDEATGKEALNVIVGEFEDMTVTATLDGDRVLNPGANIVTEVGTHTLDATIMKDGKKVVRAESLPDFEELSLRIDLGLPSLKTKEPFTFDFSNWDAEVLLDGKPIRGAVRVGKHGEHVLTVRDASGRTVEGAFSLWVEGNENPETVTEVRFTFSNPHLIYAIVVAVPTAALLGLACYFLIARRRVV